MVRTNNRLLTKVYEAVKASSPEPLETMEIVERLHLTRSVVLYRLNELRGQGLVAGKAVGAGKGTWIWWVK